MSVLAFVAGLVAGTGLLAALYGPLDLWYTIRTAWPTVLRRILLWSAITVVLLVLLSGTPRATFIAGITAHLVIHATSWLLILVGFPSRLGPTRTVQ
ncbi:MAG TPA: hypothetical protein VNL98_04220 [Gemmatimonadales bacterium]|nr:hypothetical protein [Gemmatimonadales bacterium]